VPENAAARRPLGFTSYEEARAQFSWNIPSHFNIGVDVCDRWAESDPLRPAIMEYDPSGGGRTWSFGELKEQSNRLANLLRAKGIQPGDRIAILLPQRFETALAHVAAYKLGCIAVPLFTQFGVEALRHRLRDSGAAVLITDETWRSASVSLDGELPALLHVIFVDDGDGRRALLESLRGFSSVFAPQDTAAEDPALLIYTSGTTGPSKGALHAHRVLLGHLPGVEMSHSGFPLPGDCMWTPADWAWIGGLLDVLMPALHHGVPVVAYRFRKFDPEAAYALIERCRITNVFLPPTALRMMMSVASPATRWSLKLRCIASGGESLDAQALAWGRRELGIPINEFYGQTECNVVLSSCAAWFESQSGSIGKPVPGHELAIVSPDGHPIDSGQVGEIGIRAPDPVMFLEYWNANSATQRKFRGPWLMTGDLGVSQPNGFIRFLARSDDVITSAGYRIGPSEIEQCLARHAATRSVAVVGLTDPLRTETVAAFVVLNDGFAASDSLGEELQNWVANQLGHYLRPRLVRFVDELPLTATGKIMRSTLRESLR
jgi:acetyl-CoA synthetase